MFVLYSLLSHTRLLFHRVCLFFATYDGFTVRAVD